MDIYGEKLKAITELERMIANREKECAFSDNASVLMIVDHHHAKPGMQLSLYICSKWNTNNAIFPQILDVYHHPTHNRCKYKEKRADRNNNIHRT